MDVLVVGAGLAGLTAAREMADKGLDVGVVEARSRVGGRMMTVDYAGRPLDDGHAVQAAAGSGWFDVGATWHWDGQPLVRALADELGIEVFEQHAAGKAIHEEPDGSVVDAPAPPTAYRFAGGAQQICERVAESLPVGALSTGVEVHTVSAGAKGGSLLIDTSGPEGDATVGAHHVVLAVPPRLVLQNIEFRPRLGQDFVTAMDSTQTWMADAIKCIAVYSSPFWRTAGLSGSAFSHDGPLLEVHDASSPDGTVAALWGLVNPDPHLRDMAADERVSLILDQLGRLFGADGADPEEYFERDWTADPNTAEVEPPDHSHQAPTYGDPVFAEPWLNGRLMWAGTETVAEGGGHMEGAVASGLRAARLVIAASG